MIEEKTLFDKLYWKAATIFNTNTRLATEGRRNEKWAELGYNRGGAMVFTTVFGMNDG